MTDTQSLLVGDIGGTKTVLARARIAGERVILTDERRYASARFADLTTLVSDYLGGIDAVPEQAAFAVAGPVVAECSKTTNLPWAIDARVLEQRLGVRRARLLNDLEAVAWGVAALDDSQLAVLQPGDPTAVGNACVVAAGTGLGQAGLFWDGRAHRPFATEGGHADFAPTDEREAALAAELRARFGRVSWERLVSGMGIVAIHDFLTRWRGSAPTAPRPELADDRDRAATIAAQAAAGGCPICRETMELFVTLYGREAGNCALKHLALGGLYLGGGIAPKNLGLFQTGAFLRAFLDKGRMREVLERVCVRVILDERTPLLGAARFLVGA